MRPNITWLDTLTAELRTLYPNVVKWVAKWLCVGVVGLVSACGYVGYDPKNAESSTEEGESEAVEPEASEAEVGNGPETVTPVTQLPLRVEDCSNAQLLEGTLALYTFDSPLLAAVPDQTGSHDGIINGTVTWSEVPGPDGCGSALLFGDVSENALAIADDEAFAFDDGSVDFWFFLTECAPSGNLDVLWSRAQDGEASGEYQFAVDDSCVAWLRADPTTESTGTGGGFLDLGVTLEIGRWMHLAFNLGTQGFEFWIDGQQRYVSSLITPPMAPDKNGFMFGASNDTSNPLGQDHASKAGFDHIRVSNVRRDFRFGQ